MTFSPDGKYIAATVWSSVINLIDTERMEICHVFQDKAFISNITIYLSFYYIFRRRLPS